MLSTTHHTLTARLAPRAGTSALLRVLSILSGRGTDVQSLHFELSDEAATVTATVAMGNRDAASLRQAVLRSVDVTEVVVYRVNRTGDSAVAGATPHAAALSLAW